MADKTIGRSKLFAVLVGAAVVAGFVFGPAATPADGKEALAGRTAELAALGLKFHGANSCSNAKCHGAAEAAPAPKPLGNEFTTWSEKDPHARSFESLKKPDVKKNPAWGEIGKKMGIADVTKANECLSCHSLNVPANLQGDKFSMAEGNTCTACHGPSEKWLEPHAADGWTNKERAAAGNNHDSLLKKWGLYDTKSAVARADICVSCHLAIDPAMVAAGHPQPIFELDFYSTMENFATDTFATAHHWRDPGGYYNVNLWVAGQVVCLRDAMKQLAARASGGADAAAVKDAYELAMSHGAMVKHISAATSVKVDAGAIDAVKAAMGKGDKAALAAAATAAAEAAGKALDAASAFKADKAAAVALMKGVSGDAAVVADSGLHGAEQQALAVYSLYNNFAAVEKPGDKDAVLESVAKLFGPLTEKKVDPAQFTKDLAEAAGKLPK